MKNIKVAGMLLGAVFAIGISAGGCTGGEAEEQVPTGSQEQESMEPGAEKEQQDAGPSSKGEAAQVAGQQTESVQQEPEHDFGNLREFEAVALDGSTFTQDGFADKDVTVINFWALSCGPCLAEMPALAEFGKALPDNVQLMTVCLDGGGYEEYVQYVVDQTGFEGTTLLYGDGDLLIFCRKLQYTPTTVLVDHEGNSVGYAIIGARDNLAESYTLCINSALSEMGKAEISADAGAESGTETE